jgi:integrase
MSGTLREKTPGNWEVRFEAGRDPVTGHRRQLSRSVLGNKRKAQEMLNSLVAEAQSGRYDGTTMTFEQLCTKWLDLAKIDLSPTTLRTYKTLLHNRIFPALGSQSVLAIRTVDLDRLYTGLIDREGLSSSTVRQVHAIIRRAFRQAVLWGWVSVSPATNATPPRLVKPDLSPPDVAQVVNLLSRAKERDPELGHFFHIAATTGARRGEICAIRWKNLDTKLRTLTIERAIIEATGGIFEKDTKTHSNRRIALDDDTLEAFAAQYALCADRASQVGMKITKESFVFSREPDGAIAWTPSSVTKQFVAVKESLGYEGMRLHDLRHFAATRLMAAGVPVRTVSGRLGHANPSITLSVYTHFVEASDQVAANVLGDLLSMARPKSRGRAKSKA